MATIAGPRTKCHHHVGTLVAVTPDRPRKSLKRSPCRQANQGASEKTASLRDTYLASANQLFEAMKGSSQHKLGHDQTLSAVAETFMAPASGYQRLSSGPSSPVALSTSAVESISSTRKGTKLADVSSEGISSPAMLLKAACDKPLPPKPILRPQESPEKRGVFDAQDIIANSLNGRYPPLEPANTPEISRPDQHSPTPSSFQITPSLLSRNQTPNSVSLSAIEYGVATSKTIQPITNSHISVVKESTDGTRLNKYNLKAPGSSRIPRHSSLLQGGLVRYGSPTRSAKTGNKIDGSTPRKRQALRVRGRSSPSMTGSRSNVEGVTQQEKLLVNSSPFSTFGSSDQRPDMRNPLEESVTNEGTQRTSSKYGYNIRESFDARDAIMGKPGSIVRRPTRTPPHPPRTSSLLKTPSPRPIGSGTKPMTLPTSRLSLLYRQTAASAARSSQNAKKIGDPRASTSRIPQSRTLASFGDVSKGMKNLGRKVGKIIPGRRSIQVEPSSDEFLMNTPASSRGLRRQASRLLTTYKSSGMEESPEGFNNLSVAADRFLQPEPNDRHEPDEVDRGKKIWSEESQGHAYDHETGHFLAFGVRDDGQDEDEDEERPPSRDSNGALPSRHYVENAAEDDEDYANAEIPPTPHTSIESNTTTAVGVQTDPASIPDLEFADILRSTGLLSQQLLSYATELRESPLRPLMIESATHLAEGIGYIQEASIALLQTNQALDQIALILAASTHRLSLIVQEVQELTARPGSH